MAFRNQSDAAQARADALERENLDLREQLEAQRAITPPPRASSARSSGRLGKSLLGGGLATVAAGIVLGYVGLAPPLDIILALCGIFGFTMTGAGTVMTLVHELVHVVGPNELLVISGRKQTLDDGSVSGYRVARAGRVVRLPVVEHVDRLCLEVIPLSMKVDDVYLHGGSQVSLECKANVKLASDGPELRNAVERFLGTDRESISLIARETLEGALRGVAAVASLDELRGDQAAISQAVSDEAASSMSQHGLHLDTFHVQSVDVLRR